MDSHSLISVSRLATPLQEPATKKKNKKKQAWETIPPAHGLGEGSGAEDGDDSMGNEEEEEQEEQDQDPRKEVSRPCNLAYNDATTATTIGMHRCNNSTAWHTPMQQARLKIRVNSTAMPHSTSTLSSTTAMPHTCYARTTSVYCLTHYRMPF
jgi:hypothetical protein